MLNVKKMSGRERLSEDNHFVRKQQVRAVLKILGASYVHKPLLGKATVIIKDMWPWKVRRLRMLINAER